MKRINPSIIPKVTIRAQPINFPDHFSHQMPIRIVPTTHVFDLRGADRGVEWSNTGPTKEDDMEKEYQGDREPPQVKVTSKWTEKQISKENEYRRLLHALMIKISQLYNEKEDPNDYDWTGIEPGFIEWLSRQDAKFLSIMPNSIKTAVDQFRQQVGQKTGNGEIDSIMDDQGYRYSEDATKARPICSLVNPASSSRFNVKTLSGGGFDEDDDGDMTDDSSPIDPSEQIADDQAELSEHREQFTQKHLEKYGVLPSFSKTQEAFPDTAKAIKDEDLMDDDTSVPSYTKLKPLTKTLLVKPINQ